MNLQTGEVMPARKGRIRSTASLLAFSLGLTATLLAAPAQPKGSADQPSNKPHSSRHSWFEIGRASWYGKKFQGRRTAGGEKFDMNALTCAHRSLPMGSWVRVTNLGNRKVAFVRVNDRGPVPDNRMIDLSWAAAHRLGIGGTAKVRIERVTPNDPELIASLMKEGEPPLFPGMPGVGGGRLVGVADR
ncbi:septal ring lytic transglycosylase RlpA family protein [Bryocella elongata]|nr:septal ring lytic transglycosylase RlpA family protein [Bryocella elongata]